MGNYFDDPLVSRELEGMVDEMDILGYDINDPEMGANIFQNLKKKITGIAKKKKVQSAKIQTSAGTLDVGPQGISITNPTTGIPEIQSAAKTSPVEILKNPLVIGGAAAVVLLLMVSKKRR